MSPKKIHLSRDNHDRLGGPRAQSRETSKDNMRQELGVDRRRLTKETAADHGVIRGRDLTAHVLKAEEEGR